MPEAKSSFLVLLALKDGGKHGYEIARCISERSHGFFSLSYGALYPVLHKLEQDGLVEGAWEGGEDSKRRRVYTLTRAGHKSLADEREHHRQLGLALRGLAGGKL